MLGGVTRHMLPLLSGPVLHLHVNSPYEKYVVSCLRPP